MLRRNDISMTAEVSMLIMCKYTESWKCHYENMPRQNTKIFGCEENENSSRQKSIFSRFSVKTSCFGSKIHFQDFCSKHYDLDQQ